MRWLCCKLDDPNFESWEEQEIFLFSKMSRLHPPRFVTMFTEACLWSISSATWIQSTLFHPNCVRSILILCFQLWLILPLCLPTVVFWPQHSAYLVFPIHTTCRAHLILSLVFPILYGVVYQPWHSFLCSLLQAFPSVSCPRTLYVCEICWTVYHNWSLCSSPVQKLKSDCWISHLSRCFRWLSVKLMDWQ